jgi:hypothetical protein
MRTGYTLLNLTDLPPEYRSLEARDKLGKLVCEMIAASDSDKADLEGRWDQIDRHYFGDGEVSLEQPWDGAPTYQFQVVKPKIDQVAANIAGPLSKADPYVIVRAGGPKSEILDEVQQHLHKALHLAEYGLKLRQAISLIQRRGECQVRAAFVPGYARWNGKRERCKISLDVIDPKNFDAYPAHAISLDDMVFSGHKFSMTRREIEEKQMAGLFFKYAKLPGGPENLSEDKQDNSVESEDEPLVIHDGTLNKSLDKKNPDKLFRIQVIESTGSVLYLKPFQSSRTWYRDLYLHREDANYFNKVSRGFDLVAPQLFASDMRHMMVWGAYSNAFPVVFAENWALGKQNTKIKPGLVIPVESIGRMFSPPNKTDLAAFPFLIDIGRQDGDIAARISQNASGGTLRPGQTTATEASQIAMGQAVGVGEDTYMVSMGISNLACFIVEELLWANYEEWTQDYGSVLPPVKKEDFEGPYWYEVNGTTPVDSPQAQSAQITAMLQALGAIGQMEVVAMQTGGGYVPILAKYPDLLGNLMRGFIDVTTLPGKDGFMPRPEEEENGQTDLSGILGLAPMGMDQRANAGMGGIPQGGASPTRPALGPGQVL